MLCLQGNPHSHLCGLHQRRLPDEPCRGYRLHSEYSICMTLLACNVCTYVCACVRVHACVQGATMFREQKCSGWTYRLHIWVANTCSSLYEIGWLTPTVVGMCARFTLCACADPRPLCVSCLTHH